MMRSTLLKDYDHDKDIEKFSGDEPDAAMKFLEHDINGQDNAEAKYGNTITSSMSFTMRW